MLFYQKSRPLCCFLIKKASIDNMIPTNNASEIATTKRLHDMYSYCITLFSPIGEMYTLWLPKTPEGYYQFPCEANCDFLSIVAKNGRWFARCGHPAFFSNVSNLFAYDSPLDDCQFLAVDCEDHSCSLYIESVLEERLTYRSYSIPSSAEIRIGNHPQNDICYSDPNVSEKHATIIRSESQWRLRDCGSNCGTYVNGYKTDSVSLKLGDVINILGMRIIVGTNFIAINDKHENVSVSPRIPKEDTTHSSGHFHYSYQDSSNSTEAYFNRRPRKIVEIEDKIITVEGPPISMDRAQMPLMLRMGSSMVIGGSAALAGNFTTLLSSVLFPLLTSKYSEKQKQEYEQNRTIKYNEYLKMKHNEIVGMCEKEQEILNRKHPTLENILSSDYTNRLWERRPIDDDFLAIRLGTGERPLCSKIDYPQRRFELEPDYLEEKMYELVEESYVLKNAPIVLSLVKDYICGILGQRKLILEQTRNIILQAAMLHSYDEVKFVMLMPPAEAKEFDSIKYLPHVWNDDRSVRFVATNDAEVYKLGEHLKSSFPDNLDNDKAFPQMSKHRPYYIVFVYDKKLLDGHEFFKDILQSEINHGMSIVAAYDELPKECHKIIDFQYGQNNTVTSLRKSNEIDTNFSTDSFNQKKYDDAVRMLSNTKLKAVTQTQELPKTITFLEMFQVATVEQLNPLKRWNENSPISSLATPVGVSLDGSLFTLDLHEKRQGPHGLVAGMTGSGKSEFIITYILSMAVNYHPDEVAFVLIDYKGGGLAGAFENPKLGIKLPHLAGTITNLDGAAIQRALVSIESELNRRQRVFNDIKSSVNDGTMDIYAYQKLYRQGKVSEPMPHLFIISDEFAELKKQEPEFMAKLISAARIGRSLGVHLILATQKPSGVVDDQIWSNSKFRVCLRVQDRGDSIEMLKRSEAAELRDTGRFYLQVGYNEFFALGQSAWCGAPYEPQSTTAIHCDESIEFLDTTGQTISVAKRKKAKSDTNVKQIVAIVKYLSELAQKEQFVSRPMWEQPLENKIILDEIYKKYNVTPTEHVNALVGVVDNPSNQEQFPLSIDLQHNRNLLIAGESGSGKTTLLQTLLFDVVKNYSSNKVNFYVLDFSSRNLTLFRNLPHCGAVLTEEDEASIVQVFSMIQNIIDERKTLFAAAEVSSYDAYIEVEELPLILFVIDNINRLEEIKDRSDLLTSLENIMSNGTSYGIKVIFTVSQINTCPMKLRRNAGSKIALRARDRYVYSDILDCRCQYEPEDTPGRGMCLINDSCCEFQTALAIDSQSEKDRSKQIRQELKGIAENSKNQVSARSLEKADDTQNYDSFCSNFDLERLPIGYQADTLKKVALPLQQFNNMSLYFGNNLCVSPVIKNLIYASRREGASVVFVPRAENSKLEAIQTTNQGLTLFSCNQVGIQQMLNTLSATVSENKKHRIEYCSTHNIVDWREPEATKVWRRYVRGKTTPVVVIFESLLDIALNIDVATSGVLGKFFQACPEHNIYFCACHYSDDKERLQRAKYPLGEENASDDEESPEYVRCKELRHIWDGFKETFCSDKFSLLFGGQFHKQDLVNLPSRWQNVKNTCSPKNIDKLLMYYRGNVYSLVIPCEKEYTSEEELDEQDIV